MKTRFALAALAAATMSTYAAAQMGPGMGRGPGPGPGAPGDCPMMEKGAAPGHHGMGGGMMGRHGGMKGEGMGPGMMGRHGGMKGEGMGAGMMGGQGHALMRALQGLDLTAEQRTKLTEIQREAQRKRHGFMGTMREMRWKMQDAQKDGFNEDAARKQFDAMAAIRKEMFEAGLATRKQVDALLTPEQRETLKKSRPGPRPA